MPVTPIESWRELLQKLRGPGRDPGIGYPPSLPGPFAPVEGASYMRSPKGAFVLVPHVRLAEAIRNGYKAMDMGELAAARLRGEQPITMVPGLPSRSGSTTLPKQLRNVSSMMTRIAGLGAPFAALGAFRTNPMDNPEDTLSEIGSNVTLALPEAGPTAKALFSGGGAASGSLIGDPEDIGGAARRMLSYGVIPEGVSTGLKRTVKYGSKGQSERLFRALEEFLAERMPHLGEYGRKALVEDVKDYLHDVVLEPIQEPVTERAREVPADLSVSVPRGGRRGNP